LYPFDVDPYDAVMQVVLVNNDPSDPIVLTVYRCPSDSSNLSGPSDPSEPVVLVYSGPSDPSGPSNPSLFSRTPGAPPLTLFDFYKKIG